MTTHDIYLLSPEISMAGLAILLILVDLVVSRKSILTIVAVLGLAVPLALSIVLWFDLTDQAATQMKADFGTEIVTFVVDKFSLFFKFLLVGATALVILASSEYVSKFKNFHGEFFALVLFATSGMMLLASTVELITIYVSLELTALPIAALAAFMRDSRSSEAGLKFLILSAISSAVLLYGMVIIYGFTGTTVLADIATQLGGLLDGESAFGGNALLFGVILVIAGFGFKISSVPFQMWAPDVYEGSPTPVTAFLSVASKAAGFAVILRVFYIAFSAEILSVDWSAVFAVLAAVSMTFGNLVAIRQNNIKRMLAYSTIAQAGYIMVGLAAMAGNTTLNTSGPVGILVYLAGYTFTNLAAFAVITAVSEDSGDDSVDSFAGLIKKSPTLAVIMTVSMISLIGIPPTIGFMAKIYLFGAAVETNLTWLAIVGVVNSVVSAYYYLRVVKTMFIDSPDERHEIHPNLGVLSASVISISGTVFFGFFPKPIIELARDAINTLIG